MYSLLKRKKLFIALVGRTVKHSLLRGTTVTDKGTTTGGLELGGRDWVQLQIQQGKVRVYSSQSAGWGVVSR